MRTLPETQNQTTETLTAIASALWKKFGPHLRIATPLGAGKPNRLLNLVYAEIKRDPKKTLTLYSALSLSPPRGKPGLERRFLDPFRVRQWGEDYPSLDYATDLQAGTAPENFRLHEFYFQAGFALHSTRLQQDYQSNNYTHVVDALLHVELDAVLQLIAADGPEDARTYSLGSNPDLTLDLVDARRERGRPIEMIGVVSPHLPYVGGEAEVAPAFFTAIVDDGPGISPVFALPRMPVDAVDHAIGFHASSLIVDGGTLQVGIGSLSDAVVAALLFRQRENAAYRTLETEAAKNFARSDRVASAVDTFREGLYGLSELITDGFMHLRKAGILTREVYDDRTGSRVYCHGAFYLGSHAFYEWLRDLEGADYDGLRMGRVSKVNDLYDPDELALRRQRKSPRFLNTCMQVTLLGGAAADTLPDGRVVSGVGGQYNFVAMSHELRDSRSVLMLRSVREDGGRRVSNLVASHGHLTIPRHLRDIIVTEYGVADVRGRTDAETIGALLAITDSAFQASLTSEMQRTGKLPRDFRLPDFALTNTSEKIRLLAKRGRTLGGGFRDFPFGSDFTPDEERLALALPYLQRAVNRGLRGIVPLFRRGLASGRTYPGALARVELAEPRGLRGHLERIFVTAALRETDPT